MTDPRRCIHGRTERQACAKCNAMDAAPAEGLDVASMQAALVAVIESNALDSDDLLWLDKMCRKAIGTDWPYLTPAPAEGLEPLDGVDCDWDENGKCRCKPAAPAKGLDVEPVDLSDYMAGWRGAVRYRQAQADMEAGAPLPAAPAKGLDEQGWEPDISDIVTLPARDRRKRHAAPAKGLDVERLARAIRATFGGTPPTARQQADRIAREYAKEQTNA